MRDEELFNAYGRERISSRQIDELTGLARGLCADGVLNEKEVEFLQKWLVANVDISGDPVIRALYCRVDDILSDGVVDSTERDDLFHTLEAFSGTDAELGEPLKSTTLPLCYPAPALDFPGRAYCLTGTFNYGGRRQCEQAIVDRGGHCASLTRKTDVLVVGVYATESWKHSAFGHKIMKACEMRDAGVPHLYCVGGALGPTPLTFPAPAPSSRRRRKLGIAVIDEAQWNAIFAEASA